MKIIAFLLMMVSMTAAQSAQVYKCPGKLEGRYTYQERPCAGVKVDKQTLKIITSPSKTNNPAAVTPPVVQPQPSPAPVASSSIPPVQNSGTPAASLVQTIVPAASLVQTIVPTPLTTGIIKNPGIGYQTFGTKSAATDPQTVAKTLPSSTYYTRHSWKFIETAPGVYDFSKIDKDLADAKAAGQRLATRVMGFNNGGDGPNALQPIGSGFTFTFNGLSTWFPNLDIPNMNSDLLNLVKALGQRYGKNPDIDSFDIGFVGAWGEFHFYGASPKPPFPSTATLKSLTDTFQSNFNVPLLINEDLHEVNLTAFNYTIQNKIGWRADCWGDWSPGWSHMVDRYPQLILLAPNAWKNGPVILEPCWDMQTWVNKKWPWQQSLQWAIDNHASQFSNKSATIPSVMLSAVQDMTARLGYRFVLNQAVLPVSISRGSTLKLILNWTNIGNAPMYFDRHLLVKLGSQITDTGISMKGFLPGSRVDSPQINTSGLTAGTYSLQIGLAPLNSQTPDINLSIVGTGKWYTLGDIKIN